MKGETAIWIEYAEENLKSARLLLEAGYLNTCLQNIQQSIEKYIKALIVEKSGTLKKTHSVNDLKLILNDLNIVFILSDEEIELIDSIYLPSKYPLGNVLPDGYPDPDICLRCIVISESVRDIVLGHLNKTC
jgi:HEPN domain-containing protein